MSTYPEVVKAILTNTTLNEDEKSILISKMMSEFQENYPELQNHATKNDITEVELKLTKEIKELDVKIEEVKKEPKEDIKELDLKIEEVKKELKEDIKELDVKLTKEIKELDVKIEEVKKETNELKVELKNVELKLTKEIVRVEIKIGEVKNDIIKWVAGMMIGQTFIIAGIVAGIFKFFMH